MRREALALKLTQATVVVEQVQELFPSLLPPTKADVQTHEKFALVSPRIVSRRFIEVCVSRHKKLGLISLQPLPRMHGKTSALPFAHTTPARVCRGLPDLLTL
jgi:hypothetical protein